jgi:putative peptide zinc metalloprotease protein
MMDMGTLPSLREELTLHTGPAQADGSPTWTIRDPLRNRYFRIGWAAFEMLRRWHLGSAAQVARAVRDETTLSVGETEVADLAGFLTRQQLTAPLGIEAVRALAALALAERQSWWTWLLHHYLFFRIPLIRPDRFLAATLPMVRWLGGVWFRLSTLAALMTGLFLAGRGWDQFAASFVDTLSPAGMLSYAVALSAVKVAHELAHAYTARHFGCRVPTMGLAFLVMWPVLYTDVNETWMLPSRRQRLTVGAAGILAELSVAAWATLAWGLLPDGPVRQAAFVLAALTWVSSLMVNLSPFMRFDGYFLVMDALEVPNLHPRAFALARWQIREWLFGLNEPPPERLPAISHAALVAFAVLVWVYRLALFLGIALLVYHFFVKVVGVILFAVEIGWFVIMPLWSEIREWRRRRDTIAAAGRWRWGAVAATLLLVTAIFPWPIRIEAPALIRAREQSVLYLPAPARMGQWLARPGDAVRQGQPVIRFSSPDLDLRLTVIEARLAGRQADLDGTRLDFANRDRMLVLAEEVAHLQAERDAVVAESARLTLSAPHDGIVADPAPDLSPGDWVSPHLPLALIRGQTQGLAVAYVTESDLRRLGPDATVTLVPTSLDQPRLVGRVESEDTAPVRTLPEPVLATVNGGRIAARSTQSGLVPDQPLTRIAIALDGPPPAHETTATALIEAGGESPVARLARSVLVVLIREWGV